ncbi:class II fructose-bisphosphate aldolase [Microterricola viridarii]|uniref:Fructose-bisphosphate aldolase, class II n=1 Tax=Microterricola viridarii TaxID=412690 RepID=A0A1H1T076_9MICO|nr:class II fructose-bisphosphate aldolase [Microterricola viridarii]SDS53667.1 fructose-bisphosphate aldolase, class II [Microterricola viridarii]
MTLVSPAALIASRNGAGVAAFNIITLEHLEAFVTAAEGHQTGVILQLSQNAVKYHGGLEPVAGAILERVRESSVPFAVQLDHASDITLIRASARMGFTSIMYDGSTLSYQDNVKTTRSLANELHDLDIWVEAELGEIGGKDGVHIATARTEPREAADFVSSTGVDGLAVAVGSSHAMTDKTARLDVRLIEAIHAAVPVPLVLHGSSGIAEPLIAEAVRAGISKVNFGTRFNVVMTDAIRLHLATHPAVTDPRRYLAAGRAAIKADAETLLKVLHFES